MTELFNIENPFYEKWKRGRPSRLALAKRKLYWQWEYDAPQREKEKRLREACEKSIKEQGDIPACSIYQPNN